MQVSSRELGAGRARGDEVEEGADKVCGEEGGDVGAGAGDGGGFGGGGEEDELGYGAQEEAEEGAAGGGVSDCSISCNLVEGDGTYSW